MGKSLIARLQPIVRTAGDEISDLNRNQDHQNWSTSEAKARNSEKLEP
jgi:hypothetical protein